MSADASSKSTVPPVTHHRTDGIDGINIFDREAESKDNPRVVLLDGFTASSRMFRNGRAGDRSC
jgi:hypothetical protein